MEKLNKKMESISGEKTLWETVPEKATPEITSTVPRGWPRSHRALEL